MKQGLDEELLTSSNATQSLEGQDRVFELDKTISSPLKPPHARKRYDELSIDSSDSSKKSDSSVDSSDSNLSLNTLQ